MYAFTFLPLINRPTRITQCSATLIDNIFTNNLCHDDLCFQGILVSDVSDHFPVFHINYGCAAQVPDECIVSRNFSYQNKIAFHEAVAEIDWGEMYTLTEAQSAFSMFHSTFTKLFNQHFPKRKIKIKYNNRKPWLTDGLKKSIRIKNKLYMKYIKIKSAYYECTYKMYRNRLTRLIKIAERKYYADLLESNKSNLKKTWNILKTIINKKKVHKVNENFKLSDDSITSDKKVISENFNDFFVNVGYNLAKRIPNVNVSPRDFVGDRLIESIYLEPVTSVEIDQIIKDLKNGASGCDDITAFVLKDTRQSINIPVCYLCNLSLSEGVFPNELKLANVLPLFKSGDPMLFNNYRPVSLLCVLSKVFEKVMYTRLLDFLELRNFLIKNQFGFRKFHSSYMALMVMMNDISKALDEGDSVIGFFLDFSKGFRYCKQPYSP